MPVRVKDAAGFALNRLLHSMYVEAARLVDEGVCSMEDADKICRYGLNHPIGPFELQDFTGLDINLAVQDILFAEYGERFRPSQLLEHEVYSGRLGRKTGAGFYDYTDRK